MKCFKVFSAFTPCLKTHEQKKPLALATYAAPQECPINVRKSFDQQGSSLTNNQKNWSLNAACIHFILKKSKSNQQSTS